MNSEHVQQIFEHYIDQFETINNDEHREYYKWEIAQFFHDEMDAVLTSPSSEFSAKLYELRKKTFNLIDSYTQPFYGLVRFAEKEPETVRQMFLDLYDTGNDRQSQVEAFLAKSHELRDKYYAGSYLYKDDIHSVTGYLFLYDPDHNYIFKATHAQRFANCVEFYDDWGYGDTVNLNVYYKMCDQLLDHIKASKELLTTDASRFSLGSLYPDTEKHILAFDLIYCCSTYNLFHGITFERPNLKEWQLIQERKIKAKMLFEELEEVKTKVQILEEAKEYVNSVLVAGATVYHRLYEEGTVKENDGNNIIVDFPEYGNKKLGTSVSIGKGILTVDNDTERIDAYRDLLKDESKIRDRLVNAEKAFAEYSENFD